MFRWLKKRRRNKLLSRPMEPAWEDYLRAHVRQYAGMDEATQHRLRERLRILVAEKHWEGCAGLVLTDEIRVVIAGNAAMLLLGAEDYFFDGLKTILVYPDTYVQTQPFQMLDLSVGIRKERRLVDGEAWSGGPLVLSWQNILDDADPESDRNLVVHEFAHVLDGLDGYTDGSPPWPTAAQETAWKEVVRAAHRQLKADYQAGRPMWLDPYALTNKAEFFAVACESFFQRPDILQEYQRPLYEQLRELYRTDPMEWMVDVGSPWQQSDS